MQDSAERNKTRKSFMAAIRSQMDKVKTSEKEKQEFKTNYVSKLEELYENIIREVENTANRIKSQLKVESGVAPSQELTSSSTRNTSRKFKKEQSQKNKKEETTRETNKRRLRKRVKPVSYYEAYSSEDDYEEEETSDDGNTPDSPPLDSEGFSSPQSNIVVQPSEPTVTSIKKHKSKESRASIGDELFESNMPKGSHDEIRNSVPMDVKIPKFKPVGTPTHSTWCEAHETSPSKKKKAEAIITTPFAMQNLTKNTPRPYASTSASPLSVHSNTSSIESTKTSLPETVQHHQWSPSSNNSTIQTSLSTPSSMDINPHAHSTNTDTFLIYATFNTKTVLIPIDLTKPISFAELFLTLQKKLKIRTECEMTYFDTIVQSPVIFDEDSFKESIKSQRKILQILIQTATID